MEPVRAVECIVVDRMVLCNARNSARGFLPHMATWKRKKKLYCLVLMYVCSESLGMGARMRAAFSDQSERWAELSCARVWAELVS